MPINDKTINNLLEKVQKSEESKAVIDVDSFADDIIKETINKKSQKDISIFSFLDSDKIKDEHKIVSQLDDVTKESEEKASEIFDIMNEVSEDLLKLSSSMENTIVFLETLSIKLNSQPELNKEILTHLEGLKKTQNIRTHADSILFEGMSLMQYQDINRQRIERVINIIRTLSKYLNLLFEGRKNDLERTSSAKHLAGDTTEDVTTNSEIEELLNTDNIEDIINSFNQDK